MGCLFWRSSRDSNPGGTFMPYEISSHASSTSLSTAPYYELLYYNSNIRKNQELYLFLFGKLHDSRHLLHDLFIVFPSVREQAVGTVLNAAFRVGKVTAAAISQRIQRAPAKQTVKLLRIGLTVAGEVFTFLVLKKIVMGHGSTSK